MNQLDAIIKYKGNKKRYDALLLAFIRYIILLKKCVLLRVESINKTQIHRLLYKNRVNWVTFTETYAKR